MRQNDIDRGVCEIDLASWWDFFDLVKSDFRRAPAYVFRGQADARWQVRSTLDRLARSSPKKTIYGPSSDRAANCPPADAEMHLNAFKDGARGRLVVGERPFSDDEWWALARHHGLSSPMVDFTASPFIALFFAFEEKVVPDDDGHLYDPEMRSIYYMPFHFDDLVRESHQDWKYRRTIYRPREGSYRLVNQAGLFVKLPEEKNLEDWVQELFSENSSTTNRHARAILTRVVILNKDRIDCLHYLNRMNINRMTLFPDLDGTAAHINALWELNFDTTLGYIPGLNDPSHFAI